MNPPANEAAPLTDTLIEGVGIPVKRGWRIVAHPEGELVLLHATNAFVPGIEELEGIQFVVTREEAQELRTDLNQVLGEES